MRFRIGTGTAPFRSPGRIALLALLLGVAWLAVGNRYDPASEQALRTSLASVALDPAPDLGPAGFGPGWDLPNLAHDRVDYWVERFTTVPEMREKFAGFLERAGRWAPPILDRLEDRGMPLDLVYLAMIESGFNPTATSPARAAGIWQFIAPTGERYGLAIDRAVDERRDPIRATDAALDYLQDLHDRFGSWYLAAAAYNTGENRVGRIMAEETGSERAAGEHDYYRIWDRLPSETRDYVPLMIAAARIAKNPTAYGFEPARLETLEWDEVVVPPATPLIRIANSVGITVPELRELNPHFRIHRTPNDRDYAVRVPAGTSGRLGALDVGPARAASD